QEVVARFGIRRGILPTQAEIEREVGRDAEAILRVGGEIVLPHIRLTGAHRLLRGLWNTEQEIREGVARADARSIDAAERAGVEVCAARGVALEVVQVEVDEIHAELQRVAAAH